MKFPEALQSTRALVSMICAPLNAKRETGILIEFAVGFDISTGAILSSLGNCDVEARFPFKNPTGFLRGLLLPLFPLLLLQHFPGRMVQDLRR